MNIARTPEAVMRLYLEEVAYKGRLELIDEITKPDMVDEANQIFGGPAGRAGLVAHIAGFRKNISDYSLSIHHIVGNNSQAMPGGHLPVGTSDPGLASRRQVLGWKVRYSASSSLKKV